MLIVTKFNINMMLIHIPLRSSNIKFLKESCQELVFPRSQSEYASNNYLWK